MLLFQQISTTHHTSFKDHISPILLLLWYSLSLSCLTGYFWSSNFKQWCYTFHRSTATNNILCKFNSAPNSYTDNIYFNAETITCILHALPSWCSSSTLCHHLLYDQNIMINCSSSTFPLLNPCSWCVVCPVLDFRSLSNIFFTGWDFQPHTQPPTWRTRVSLFVSVITFDLSGTWCHTNSITTARTALRIIWPRKPHHYVKVGIPSVGCNTYKNVYIFQNTQKQKNRVSEASSGETAHLKVPMENVCVSVAYINATNLL
jgi:hypothetical protein